MFPLLENNPYQGYIWEREWRYTKHNNLGSSAELTTSITFSMLMQKGLYQIASLFLQDYDLDFVFSYDDIRIICCDDEDENIFKEIIGKDCITKNKIQFIRTWQEYNEITDYLSRKTPNTNNVNGQIQEILAEKKVIERYIGNIENQNNRIKEIKNLRDNLDVELKKIALIEVFEKITEVNFKTSSRLKNKIMESDCEILINAIAAYQESKKSNVIRKPEGYLFKAIKESWKPEKNFEVERDEIKKQMNEVIKNFINSN
jgi:hypothetical protein